MSVNGDVAARRPIRAAVLDLDGTLVTTDTLDELCALAGYGRQSEELNRRFLDGTATGIASLMTRINFLAGLPLSTVEDWLAANPRLMPGARQLFEYFRAHRIVSVIASGSILPVLQSYRRLLGADYVLGPAPPVRNGVITSFLPEHYPPQGFKLCWSSELLGRLGISWDETVVIGDSPAERAMFELAGLSIVINPKGGVEAQADLVLHGDLAPALEAISAQQAGRPGTRSSWAGRPHN